MNSGRRFNIVVLGDLIEMLGLTVVTPAGYDFTPVMPAFFASLMISGVRDSCR